MTIQGRSIPVAIRNQVLERDGLSCRWCGAAVEPHGKGGGRRPNALHFDHVHPWSLGGDHTVQNLVVSCARCNLTRTTHRVNVRHLIEPFVERRYGRYWWTDPTYEPPVPVGPTEVATEIGEAVTRRYPLELLVADVHRGKLAATGPGEAVHVVLPISEPKMWRGRRVIG